MPTLFDTTPPGAPILTVVGSGDRLSGFTFWWSKYVRGFDETQHCARCLRGRFGKHTSTTMLLNAPFALDEVAEYDYLYICGVAGRSWKDNFHLAMKPSSGALASRRTYNGLEVGVTNAEELTIPPLEDGFRGLDTSYTRCRNFRFGVAFYQRERGR